jgi:hypothetical protein
MAKSDRICQAGAITAPPRPRRLVAGNAVRWGSPSAPRMFRRQLRVTDLDLQPGRSSTRSSTTTTTVDATEANRRARRPRHRPVRPSRTRSSLATSATGTPASRPTAAHRTRTTQHCVSTPPARSLTRSWRRPSATSTRAWPSVVRPARANVQRVKIVSVDGDHAVVQECVVSDGVIVRRDTGEVVNDDVATHNVRGELARVDGVWRVSSAQLVQRWEGVAGCALGS